MSFYICNQPIKESNAGTLFFTSPPPHLQILELPGHPYFVGVQFHPEYKSRPGKPSAPFLGMESF
jgi:CTP synthase (UTP-ammonia lyase)